MERFQRRNNGFDTKQIGANPRRCSRCDNVLSGNLKMVRTQFDTYVSIELIHEGCADQ